MKHLSLIAVCAMSAIASTQQAPDQRISMIFNDTDVAQVFMAISIKSKVNIVYASKAKVPVTIKLAVDSVEDAVQAVCAATGLVYRKVDKLFVVAPVASMKEALTPYTMTVSYSMLPGYASKILTRLQDAFPHATVRLNGDKLTFTGILTDVQASRGLVDDAVKNQDNLKFVTEIYMLKQVSAEMIAPLVKSLFPTVQFTTTDTSKAAEGQKAPEQSRWATESRGAIGLVGPEEAVKAARAMIERLDTPASADGPNQLVYKVYELKYASGPNVKKFLNSAVPEIEIIVSPDSYSPVRAKFSPVGSAISSAGGGQSGAGAGTGGGAAAAGGAQAPPPVGAAAAGQPEGQVAVGDRAKSIVLKGRENDVDAAVKLITELDRKPKQVIIEVSVVETNPTRNEKIGINYNWSPIDFHEVPSGTIYSNNPAGGAWTDNVETKPTGVGLLSRTPFNFRTLLNAMITRQEAKVLAKPSIQVIDNDQASVFIGDTIRARLTSQGALGAQNVQVAEFPVGIILLISPRINADGNITMHVNPVISTVNSVSADNVPQTSSREAETTVVVKDGETIVLGGLIRDEDRKTIEEIPFLSKLPIIGALFRSTTKDHRRTEIIVSITPHIVDDSKEAGSK